MKRRDLLKSAAFAALASGLKPAAHALQGTAQASDSAAGYGSFIGSNRLLGATPSASEISQAKQWFNSQFGHTAPAPPFSFVYDGQASKAFVTGWPRITTEEDPGNNRTQRTITWTDPKTMLQVRCVAVSYSDFPVVEWTVSFKNLGRRNTPLLENIEGLDIHLERPEDGEFVLHQNRGDSDSPESYQPFSEMLPQNKMVAFRPVGGRPTNYSYPYYNLQMAGGGVIIAVGWPGQWETTFTRDAALGLRVCAGQELTRLYLKPGEEIRAPLIALLFWQTNDRVRAQNLWRRWMLAHNLPRPEGSLPAPIFSFCDGAFFPGLKVYQASEEESLDVFHREGIKLDYLWMDAGWYPCGDDWSNTGTWKPDPVRFPHGIRAVSDYAHARGTKLIVWFEPERVTAGSWLAKSHPNWLLKDEAQHPPPGAIKDSLLNLGNPEARAWLTSYIDSFLTEQGIDLYRQDYNIDPLPFWRRNDQADRQGITENFYVQGYLAYWDELRRRHPKMLIDSCSSGGRRNDLETMRRAVPLLRSDYSPFDGDPRSAAGNQCQTYGLSSWIPYYGQGAYIQDKNAAYYARSYLCPAFAMPVNWRKEKIDWDLYRRLVKEWREIAGCMLGDYYPLTEYTLQNDRWIGWQFDRPESGDGFVQLFRRDESEESSMKVYLNGMDEFARYRVVNFDMEKAAILSGAAVRKEGLLVEIKPQPGSAVVTYRKIGKSSGL